MALRVANRLATKGYLAFGPLSMREIASAVRSAAPLTGFHYNRSVDGNNRVTNARTDTLEQPALLKPYKPRGVVFPITEGPYKGGMGIMLPELPDLADTAFTNNHCFHYAGQERSATTP